MEFMDAEYLEIVEIEIYTIQIPLIRPYDIAIGTITHTNNIVVRITASMSGGNDLLRRIEGWGEADPLNGFTHETIDSILATLQTLAPVLLGKNAFEINQLNILMHEISRDATLAVGSIDIALWDLVGKARRAPVYALLGGTCGRNSFPLLWPLANQAVLDDNLMIPDLMRKGFRTFMLKMGGEDDNVAKQILRVKSINDDYAADKIVICVDVNQGWSLEQAIQFICGVRGRRVNFIEQPLRAACDEEMEVLRQLGGGFKFAADESAQTVADTRRCLRSIHFDYISLKVGKSGGITRMKEMAGACRVMGKRILVSSFLELGIAQAAALHVAATCDNLLDCGHSFMSTLRTKDDITNFRDYIRNAVVRLPEGTESHGLGVTVDLEKLERYAVREPVSFVK